MMVRSRREARTDGKRASCRKASQSVASSPEPLDKGDVERLASVKRQRQEQRMIAIEDIYDAAFDRARFPALLEQVGGAFNAQAGFIGWTDMESGVGFQVQFGSDPQWLQAYVETYAAHDILRPYLMALKEGECEAVWPYLQQPEVQASIFYREYLVPQGIVDNLVVTLLKRPRINAHFALLRHAPNGRFSTDDVANLSALVPHLRRAVFVQSHLIRASDHVAAAEALAGRSGGNLLLLDADRRVISAEAPLDTLLRVAPGDALGDGRLGAAIATAIVSREPLAIKLPADDTRHALVILIEARALSAERFGDIAGAPAVRHAVHITRIDKPRSLAFKAIGDLYGLTRTELRVLCDAVELGDLAGIGDRLGMARATARTHLHRIYEKTDTRSFAALSNLVHRFALVAPPAAI